MNDQERIVTIHSRDIQQANLAFADFMCKTEDCFNERSKNNPKLYKNCSATQLEQVTHDIMVEVCPSTPFQEDDIRLVSGHSFPDIMATDFYGVEVKSTSKDKWTSTGSSIVESTKSELVERIYMLFGKLGGTPPEFKCLPYQDCLSNIAVTHSPRYTIDMEIKNRGDKTIFDKIGMPYEQFCNDKNKIEIVRDYYIKEALKENKHEMPWWVGRKTIDFEEEAPAIKLFNSCSLSYKRQLKAEMLILFPEVILGDYDNAALWLCTHRYLLCLNVRDLFSAGGQFTRLNNKKLACPYPAVIGKVQAVMNIIKSILTTDYNLEISEFNPKILIGENKLDNWLNQIQEYINLITYKVGNKTILFKDLNIDIKDILLYPDRFILKYS